MRNVLLAAVLAVPALVVSADPSAACCMLPKGSSATIGQAGQRAVLAYHAGREELILAVDYRIQGAAPAYFAWVITVPSEPSAYALAPRDIFDTVSDWALPLVTPPPEHPSGGLMPLARSKKAVSEPAPLEFGRRAEVGPYDIQPVRARGEAALGALNVWLEANGFPTEDPGHMAYFVREKFTFLAIKVKPPGEEKAVKPGGLLPPLHLSFETPRPYYPLRFSSRQGTLDIDIYIFTGEPLDYAASADPLGRIRWGGGDLKKNVEVGGKDIPAALSEALSRPSLAVPAGGWYLNVLRPRGVNADNSIKDWKEDVFLTTGPARTLFTAWYIGAAMALCVASGAYLARRRKTA